MFTFAIVAVMAIVGSAGGVSANHQMVVRHLRQTRRKSRAYLTKFQRRNQANQQRALRRQHQSALNYKNEQMAELTSQIHDDDSLADQLCKRALRLAKNSSRVTKLFQNFNDHRQQINQFRQQVRAIQHQAAQLQVKRDRLLSRHGQLSYSDAKTLVLHQTALNLKREQDIDLKVRVAEISQNVAQTARDIIVEAIQRGPVDLPQNYIRKSINIPNQVIKRYLMGHNEEHLRLVESMTGTDLFFDPNDPLLLHIASDDPLRRESARRVLNDLIVSRRITDRSIQRQVRLAQNTTAARVRQIGENVVESLHLGPMHPDLMKILGRLKFRTSYGQNVLSHSIEVGQMTGVMAAELGLNPRLARRAGVLHDVGKSIDHEVVGTHVELGVKLARLYHEDPVVINAIASHHGDVEPTNLISRLVSTSDALSGARPGARSESIEDYLDRLKSLEKIANEQPGVIDSYAIQAGRELRIIINPKVMDDEQSAELTKHVRDRIQKELSYPGKIKITTIRTLRAIQYVNTYPYYRYYREPVRN